MYSDASVALYNELMSNARIKVGSLTKEAALYPGRSFMGGVKGLMRGAKGGFKGMVNSARTGAREADTLAANMATRAGPGGTAMKQLSKIHDLGGVPNNVIPTGLDERALRAQQLQQYRGLYPPSMRRSLRGNAGQVLEAEGKNTQMQQQLQGTQKQLRGAKAKMIGAGALGLGAGGLGAYNLGTNIQHRRDKTQRNVAFGAGAATGLALPGIIGGLGNMMQQTAYNPGMLPSLAGSFRGYNG